MRAAIVEANALMGADTISLPADTYSTGSELTISTNLTINGAGARVTGRYRLSVQATDAGGWTLTFTVTR